MKNLKIAMVQHNARPGDRIGNTETVLCYMRKAKAKGADLVLFPECFVTSYSFPEICETLRPVEEIRHDPGFQKWCADVIAEDDEAMRQIRELAAKLQIGAVVTGFSAGKKYPRNTAWLIGRNGEILLKYSKVHTCDFSVERYLECGDSFPVGEFDGIKTGIMICYDREYPESARELALQGAELILHPNCCGAMEPRLREISVRAMENMVGIAMANPPGKWMGRSCAYSPFVWDLVNGGPLENQMAAADEYYEGIVWAEFDIGKLREWRKQEDLGKYRKPAAYRYLGS